MMCLLTSYKKKSFNKKSGAGFRFISQKYGSGNPDPRQNVTDPQHWIKYLVSYG
jgi:hypothetical protein